MISVVQNLLKYCNIILIYFFTGTPIVPSTSTTVYTMSTVSTIASMSSPTGLTGQTTISSTDTSVTASMSTPSPGGSAGLVVQWTVFSSLLLATLMSVILV